MSITQNCQLCIYARRDPQGHAEILTFRLDRHGDRPPDARTEAPDTTAKIPRVKFLLKLKWIVCKSTFKQWRAKRRFGVLGWSHLWKKDHIERSPFNLFRKSPLGRYRRIAWLLPSRGERAGRMDRVLAGQFYYEGCKVRSQWHWDAKLTSHQNRWLKTNEI